MANQVQIRVKLDSEKKHSVLYKDPNSNFGIYVPRNVLAKLEEGSIPQQLIISVEESTA